MLVFDKEAVIKAIIDAGNEDQITDAIIDDLNNFDGCTAIKSDWDALVYERELYVVKGKDGRICKLPHNLLKEVE